jgi:DNA topoisomerase-2
MPPKRTKHKQITMPEHIKKRSMWAGSTSNQSIESFVLTTTFDSHTNENVYAFNPAVLKYPPALYKCIDEITVNAIDHQVIHQKEVKEIRFNVDDEGVISIMNDGPGITIEMVETTDGKKMYSPQLVFSQMLTGSNLDDDENPERIVGGQNGLGAKITAVFSKYFTVETVDEESKQHYIQTFRDGLSTIESPVITQFSKIKKAARKPFTKITFLLNFSEFKLTINKFKKTLFHLVQSRAWQAAAYTDSKVYFNDELVPLDNGFPGYCRMFSEYEIFQTKMSYVGCKYPWDVCIGVTDGKDRQMSMVNGVFVQSGGTHIKHIQNNLVEGLRYRIEKQLKRAKVKFNRNLLLNNLFIFMKGSIPNPDFLSQTKDAVSSPIESFSMYTIPESHWSNLWELVEPVVMASFLKKQLGAMKVRANRGKVDVPKYREANYCRNAKQCHNCGLIITEGDSASGTAHTGLLSEASPDFNYDWFGVYGIQGVPMNALKESKEYIKTKKDIPKKGETKKDIPKKGETKKDIPKKTSFRVPNGRLLANERLSSLIKVLGLDFNKSYDNTEQGKKEFKTLRYGFIAGLTDQDLDGFNIFGLICTFFMTYWPELVHQGYIRRIYTPLVRAYPKARTKNDVLEFYTEKEASDWVELYGKDNAKSDYTFNYYKGLGSHNVAYGEITQMFKNIDGKLATYIMDDNAITSMLTYYGSDTAPRKIALADNVIDESIIGLELPISQQFTVDTKMYQRDNILRKLLSAIDGFVGSRRKVFFTARKHGHSKIKVAGLASKCVSDANYHHGEASLEQTIIRMAQSYPLARNLPLLQPRGSFGTRDKGYKNSAASRYIFTSLNYRLAEKLFRKEDEYILEYELVDGNRYEPKYYVPVIPYSLCENDQLPATGWQICVHARDINSLFKNARAMIKGQKKCSRLPMWGNNFVGEVREVRGRKYFVGRYKYDSEANTINITELPPGKWSNSYLKGDDKVCKNPEDKKGIQTKEWIEDFEDKTKIDKVDITIWLKPGAYDVISEEYGNADFDCFEDYLELKEPIYNRINLINEKHEVVEYRNYEDVFNDWFSFRKKLYSIRVEREIIVNNLQILMLKEMQVFSKNHSKYKITSKTSEVSANNIIAEAGHVIYNKTLLENPRYTSISKMKHLATSAEDGATYNYLLNMSYRDLTEDAFTKRVNRIKDLESRQIVLMDDSDSLFPGSNIWLRELDELEKVIVDGLASEWFYGENVYKFKDSTVANSTGTKKKKKK